MGSVGSSRSGVRHKRTVTIYYWLRRNKAWLRYEILPLPNRRWPYLATFGYYTFFHNNNSYRLVFPNGFPVQFCEFTYNSKFSINFQANYFISCTHKRLSNWIRTLKGRPTWLSLEDHLTSKYGYLTSPSNNSKYILF